MKKLWANIALATACVTLVSGCTITDETAPTPAPTASVTPQPTVQNYPAATNAVDTKLVITTLDGNGLEVSTRQLSCSGTTAVSPTNIPDADAACEVIESSPQIFHTEPKPTDDKKCTDTGNQVIADVFGESHGKHIRVSFLRNNLCNTKVWDSITPVIGLG